MVVSLSPLFFHGAGKASTWCLGNMAADSPRISLAVGRVGRRALPGCHSGRPRPCRGRLHTARAREYTEMRQGWGALNRVSARGRLLAALFCRQCLPSLRQPACLSCPQAMEELDVLGETKPLRADLEPMWWGGLTCPPSFCAAALPACMPSFGPCRSHVLGLKTQLLEHAKAP